MYGLASFDTLLLSRYGTALIPVGSAWSISTPLLFSIAHKRFAVSSLN